MSPATAHGPRTPAAQFQINDSTTFNLGSSTLDNNHTFNINPSQSVDIQGSSATFLNDSGGTLTINGSFGPTAGILNMHGNALVNDGVIMGSGVINMQGAGPLPNTAARSPSPGRTAPAAPGHLVIDDGGAPCSIPAPTHAAVAPAAQGRDSSTCSASRSLHAWRHPGLSRVSRATRPPQRSFNVLTWGSASGMFDAATGLVFGPVALDPIFSDTGLTLVARTITQQAGSGDQTLTGSTSHDNVLVGGSGDSDTLIAAPGSDLLIGGSGNTTFVPRHRQRPHGRRVGHQYSGLQQPARTGQRQSGAGHRDHQHRRSGYPDRHSEHHRHALRRHHRRQRPRQHHRRRRRGRYPDRRRRPYHLPVRRTVRGRRRGHHQALRSGRDIIAILSSAFGLGINRHLGQNFSSIAGARSTAPMRARTRISPPPSRRWCSASMTGSLCYDPHGTGPALYPAVAHVGARRPRGRQRLTIQSTWFSQAEAWLLELAEKLGT